ncbi:MAG: hypothetical protein Q4E43_05870 [Akkermansia sp.]|nr:hypothetical protein [Akkermansia sp.]
MTLFLLYSGGVSATLWRQIHHAVVDLSAFLQPAKRLQTQPPCGLHAFLRKFSLNNFCKTVNFYPNITRAKNIILSVSAETQIRKFSPPQCTAISTTP